MDRASRGIRLGMVVLLGLLLPASAAAQVGAAWTGCRTDSLSIFNCAGYYSGTVTYTAELKTASGTAKTVITATVTAGRVSCAVSPPGEAEFSGAGMLVVEHKSTENSGGYEVLVWCPAAAGEKVGRRQSPGIEIRDQEAGNYARLTGKDAYEHPDSDEANGVSGSVTVTWRLERR